MMTKLLPNKSFVRAILNPTLLSMFFLGLSCGLPLALIASTLKTWLASIDISVKEIAAFAFVAAPYSTKFIWSPFIDAIKIPYLDKLLGHRRSWLLVIQALLMAAIFLLGNSDPQHNLHHTIIAATLVAFLSASQDIVVDAYRIEKLPLELQAMGATMYVYGYRLGLYFAGAGLLLFAHKFSWEFAYNMGALVIIIGILTTLSSSSSPEYQGKKNKHNQPYLEQIFRAVINPFKEFITINKWYYILIFIVLFKLGEGVAGNLINTFLIKKGFTLSEIALYVKTYGLAATLVGLALGGIIVQRFGLFNSLLFAGLAQGLSNFMFIYQDQIGHDTFTLALTIGIDNIAGAIGDVVFIAYLSSICSFQFAATQYALLSSISAIARTMLSGFSGFIADDYGWSVFFAVTIIAAIPGILMIFKIKDIHRRQERFIDA